MVKNVISRANKSVSISTAAALIASSYFASALLGLIRDRLLVAHFGIGGTLDSYFAAFSIPDLMFYLLVSGALSVAFITTGTGGNLGGPIHNFFCHAPAHGHGHDVFKLRY